MEKKKSNVGIVICIIIIILLLATIGGMYYYYNYMDDNENPKNKNTEDTVQKSEKKIDNSKEYVYDATYNNEYKDLKDKYYISWDEYYSFDDICVPYININSDDATTANNEIKEIFNELVKIFKTQLEDAQIAHSISNYKYYINDNYLSIVIMIENGGSAINTYEYYTYNFDLNTLKLVDYDEICNYAKLIDNIDSKVENAIRNDRLSLQLKDENIIKNFSEGTTVETFINNSINNYKESVSNKTIQYYLNGEGELNIVVSISFPAEGGSYNTILKIK